MLGFLLRSEGYTVQTVTTIAAGLDVLLRDEVDLLVLDLMLPDGSGLQVCRQLRAAGRTLPIMVVSALGSQADKLGALESGADDYLTKPFDPAEILARVLALARRTQEVRAPELQTRLCVGSICLDMPNQSVVLNTTGKTLPLTKMEAQLLHVLMRNAGQVVSHDRLISEAWGSDYEGSSNQLEVYVHRLRRKLRQELDGQELIRTVPGGSYEVVGPITSSA